VEAPEDAVARCTRTEIDVLALGPYVLSRRPLVESLTMSSGV